MVAAITLKPDEIKPNAGIYFNRHTIATAARITHSTAKDWRAAGIISAMNMAYSAIPIAFCSACGT